MPMQFGNLNIGNLNSIREGDIAKREKDIKNKIDAEVAGNIIDKLFTKTGRCLSEDKSNIKISLGAKGFIKGIILNDKVRSGIKEYVAGMGNKDIEELLDDIEIELTRRRK